MDLHLSHSSDQINAKLRLFVIEWATRFIYFSTIYTFIWQRSEAIPFMFGHRFHHTNQIATKIDDKTMLRIRGEMPTRQRHTDNLQANRTKIVPRIFRLNHVTFSPNEALTTIIAAKNRCCHTIAHSHTLTQNVNQNIRRLSRNWSFLIIRVKSCICGNEWE